MKQFACVLTMLALASCSHSERRDEWFQKDATPPGKYASVKFLDSIDTRIQQLLLQLEKLESGLTGKDADRADNEANKIVRMLARATERSLTQVCEHIVWKLSTGPEAAAVHETYLLDFLGRCQELIFEISGDDAPTVENLGAYCLNASRRAGFLRLLIKKGFNALQKFRDADAGVHYADLVCGVLERSQWGAMRRIDRVTDPESPAYRRSVTESLYRYRERLDP